MAGSAQVLPFVSRTPARESPISHVLTALFVPGGIIALLVIGIATLARGLKLLFTLDPGTVSSHGEQRRPSRERESASGKVIRLESRRRAG